MNGLSLEKVKERLWTFWDNFLKRADEEGATDYSRERIVVFVVALILALCLWFLVNLSRTYVLNINLPVDVGEMPEDQALAGALPDFLTASVQGEGWKLISLYNNPPRITVNVASGDVSLYDQVQQQMNAMPDIDVQKVQPNTISLDLEERVSKTVPLRSNVYVSFRGQYNFVGSPDITPDSVTVTGARSIIDDITYWETDSVAIENVRNDIATMVRVKQPESYINVSQSTVRFSANVAEFTEGEARVLVRTRNLPPGENITYSPSYVTVRYDVPIQEYTELEDQSPFRVYVPYEAIRRDSTGFISPEIEVTTDQYHIKVKSHQPSKVAYFQVLGN